MQIFHKQITVNVQLHLFRERRKKRTLGKSTHCDPATSITAALMKQDFPSFLLMKNCFLMLRTEHSAFKFKYSFCLGGPSDSKTPYNCRIQSSSSSRKSRVSIWHEQWRFFAFKATKHAHTDMQSYMLDRSAGFNRTQ